ncbi:hypothetical protein TRICI_000690 [Trichomonascus ciferrii]|uniref:Uncharacterized protein n=1 Tax=Trichomonascus ciferrii TaxID=44093 RepID=A0A642VC18_9ASCO|nr:hypothetical protein TRICI_000690 [Trichomonascus ciferrii]
MQLLDSRLIYDKAPPSLSSGTTEVRASAFSSPNTSVEIENQQPPRDETPAYNFKPVVNFNQETENVYGYDQYEDDGQINLMEPDSPDVEPSNLESGQDVDMSAQPQTSLSSPPQSSPQQQPHYAPSSETVVPDDGDDSLLFQKISKSVREENQNGNSVGEDYLLFQNRSKSVRGESPNDERNDYAALQFPANAGETSDPAASQPRRTMVPEDGNGSLLFQKRSKSVREERPDEEPNDYVASAFNEPNEVTSEPTTSQPRRATGVWGRAPNEYNDNVREGVTVDTPPMQVIGSRMSKKDRLSNLRQSLDRIKRRSGMFSQPQGAPVTPHFANTTPSLFSDPTPLKKKPSEFPVPNPTRAKWTPSHWTRLRDLVLPLGITDLDNMPDLPKDIVDEFSAFSVKEIRGRALAVVRHNHKLKHTL